MACKQTCSGHGTSGDWLNDVRNTLVSGAENAGDLNVCCGIFYVTENGKRYVSSDEFIC